MAARWKSFLGIVFFSFIASSAGGNPHRVEIRDFFFSPSIVTAVAGDTVEWEVMEECCLQHTVTRTSSPNTWNSGPLALEQTFRRSFPTSGTFSYFCSPHQGIGMTGSIVVRPRPSTTGLPGLNWLGLLLLGLSLTAAAIWFLERRRQTA